MSNSTSTQEQTADAAELTNEAAAGYLSRLANAANMMSMFKLKTTDVVMLRSIAAKLAKPTAQPTPPADTGEGEKPAELYTFGTWPDGEVKLRKPKSGIIQCRADGVNDQGVIPSLGGRCQTWQQLADEWQMSVDGGKTWKQAHRGGQYAADPADVVQPAAAPLREIAAPRTTAKRDPLAAIDALRPGLEVAGILTPAADAPTPSPAPVEAADFEPLTVQILDAVVPSVNAEDLATFDESTFDTPSPAPVEPFTLAGLRDVVFDAVEKAADANGQTHTIMASGNNVVLADQAGDNNWSISIAPVSQPVASEQGGLPAEPVVTPAPSAQGERVPFTAETWPKGVVWIRPKDAENDARWLVTGVEEKKIETSSAWLPYDLLANNHLYSTDGGNSWAACTRPAPANPK